MHEWLLGVRSTYMYVHIYIHIPFHTHYLQILLLEAARCALRFVFFLGCTFGRFAACLCCFADSFCRFASSLCWAFCCLSRTFCCFFNSFCFRFSSLSLFRCSFCSISSCFSFSFCSSSCRFSRLVNTRAFFRGATFLDRGVGTFRNTLSSWLVSCFTALLSSGLSSRHAPSSLECWGDFSRDSWSELERSNSGGEREFEIDTGWWIFSHLL